MEHESADGPLHSHVSIVDDILVAEGGKGDVLIHVEVALDPRAVEYLLVHKQDVMSDTDARMLVELLERGDPLDAVCVAHVAASDPNARAVASGFAARMVGLIERIHTALKAQHSEDSMRYVWNESKGTVEVVGQRSAPKKENE